jgi:glycosyltransferase involved in cell wall biosynthesis
MEPTLGIVVPTLQERSLLPGCLDGLAGLGVPVLVVDAGSPDGTAEIAADHPSHPEVLTVGGGRHRQLNAALERLNTDWVLVLPADARLLPGAAQRIINACTRLPGVAACLDLWPDKRTWIHRLRGRWSAQRSRLTGGAYLDQAPIFHRRSVLDVGCFRACGSYDSADLGWRLRHLGPFSVLPEPVVVSCREYRRLGFWGATLRHQIMRYNHLVGMGGRQSVTDNSVERLQVAAQVMG